MTALKWLAIAVAVAIILVLPKLYDKAFNNPVQVAEREVIKGKQLVEEQNYAEAAVHYQRAIDAFPKKITYASLAECYQSLGEYDKAESAVRRGLAMKIEGKNLLEYRVNQLSHDILEGRLQLIELARERIRK